MGELGVDVSRPKPHPKTPKPPKTNTQNFFSRLVAPRPWLAGGDCCSYASHVARRAHARGPRALLVCVQASHGRRGGALYRNFGSIFSIGSVAPLLTQRIETRAGQTVSLHTQPPSHTPERRSNPHFRTSLRPSFRLPRPAIAAGRCALPQFSE